MEGAAATCLGVYTDMVVIVYERWAGLLCARSGIGRLAERDVQSRSMFALLTPS